MKFSILLSDLTASSISLAAPTSNDVDKRADTAVYLCNDRNFSGYCVHITSPSGTCVPLAADLDDLTSSVGPDQGSFCYFFVYVTCRLFTISSHLLPFLLYSPHHQPFETK